MNPSISMLVYISWGDSYESLLFWYEGDVMVYLKDGYVFYQRLNSPDGQQNWKNLYQSAMSDFSSMELGSYQTTYSDIADRLISAGQAEQAKERRLLQEIFGVNIGNISLNEYPKFIKTINELMGLKDQFQNLIVKLRRNKGKERAPTAASYFDSYLSTAITKRLRGFIDTQKGMELIADGNYNGWIEELTGIIETSIEDAVKKMSEQKDKIDGEEVRIWAEAASLLQKTNGQLQQFKNDVFKRFNLQNVIREIFDWQTKRYQEQRKTTRGLAKMVKGSMNMGEIGARSAAGFVEEYIVSSMQSMSRDGGTLSSNMVKSDNIHLFSATVDISLDNIFQQLNDSLTGNSLEKNRGIIENFYNNYLGKIKDGFIVFENVKNYSLGNNFRGFSTGKSQPLSQLPSILNEIGLNIDGDSLVNLLYNTIGGAIGEDRQSYVRDQIRLSMSGAIANFLFDDWQMIGQSGDRSIHIFNLNGVLVPLSYLLISMGEAIKRVQRAPSDYFKVTFNMPGSILWPERVPMSDGENIYDYWEQQRQDVESRSTFSIKFLANFKSLLGQLIKA